ncbi:MAG: response regulator transcription factor [Sulfurospirillaceae bacterium]|nr:response regulator transcription factor [Sulfurospirillaceae bacterium]
MSIPRYKILVIEDDKQIQKLLEVSLEEHQFLLKICGNQKEGMAQAITFNPDLILLDLGLPDGDGKVFLQKIREFSEVPIIVVSARNAEQEIVDSLNLGADDYLVKPFFVGELIARINSALRHFAKKETIPQMKMENLELDVEKREFRLDGIPLHLTPLEFSLLKFLMQNAGKALTHAQILKNVWGVGYQNDTKILRVFVNQVRKKIETDPNRPKILITISGVGYRFG